MKIGAEDKKKVALLAALSVVAVVTVYVQFFSGAPTVGGVTAARPPGASGLPSRPTPPRQMVRPAPRRRVQGGGQAFQPVWERAAADETFNPLEADPSLRTELLAAVRSVEFSNVQRNIFEFTDRPVVLAAPTSQETERAAELQRRAEQAAASVPTPVAPPAAPRAPRIDWRYYGFASGDSGGERRAFLLDGTDVLIGGEGDVFKSRYKIVRIEAAQIVIEDMQFGSEQQLSLEAPRG